MDHRFQIALLLSFSLSFFGSICPASAEGIPSDSEIASTILRESKSVSDWYESIDGNCKALLVHKKDDSVDSVQIDWSGDCLGGAASGVGVLTLIFDGVPIFSEEFGRSTASVMTRGVPTTTLRPSDFLIHQSACKDAGITIGNVRGYFIAELPKNVSPNYWTLYQNAYVASNSNAGHCSGRLPSKLAFVSDKNILASLATPTGNYRSIGQYFSSRDDLHLPSWARQWNKGIELHSQQMTLRAKEAEALAASVASKNIELLRVDFLDRGKVIKNLADFFEVLGPLVAGAELSAGRRLIAESGSIAFLDGKLAITYIQERTSAVARREELAGEAGQGVDGFMDSWNMAMDTASGVTSISATCLFDPDVETSKLESSTFEVTAVLLEMNGNAVAMNCSPE